MAASALIVVLLGSIEAMVALVTAYVVVLSVAAVASRKRPRVHHTPEKTFAVLVPAHNEELLIGHLLDSLGALGYPRDLFDVCVVADNCSDATPAVARSRGALVFERHDLTRIGKGYALNWLLERLARSSRKYDAIVVLDADSEVSSNFLEVMNDHLIAGRQAIQAYYSVANPTSSWSAGLRWLALALVHYLRPLGKAALGGSAGLKGNGMCFSSETIATTGWDAFTLAEDVEYHLRLVLSGIRVEFAPDATVLAQMPASLQGARTQNLRWERGRIQMVRKYVPDLLWSGLATGNPAQIDAALEQIVPPFSVPVAVAGLCLIGGEFAGSGPLAIVALALIFGQLIYVLTGLLLVHAPSRIYLYLLCAPAYVIWKSWIYLIAVFGAADARWVRTSRAG